jgi:hypothetical protein
VAGVLLSIPTAIILYRSFGLPLHHGLGPFLILAGLAIGGVAGAVSGAWMALRHPSFREAPEGTRVFLHVALVGAAGTFGGYVAVLLLNTVRFVTRDETLFGILIGGTLLGGVAGWRLGRSKVRRGGRW